MSIRPVYLAVPTALVATVGFAWLTSATAYDGGFDGGPRIAQAAPPAAQPPAGGGGADRRAELHPLAQDAVNDLRRVDVEVRRGFVEVEDRRFVQQRPREQEFFAHRL